MQIGQVRILVASQPGSGDPGGAAWASGDFWAAFVAGTGSIFEFTCSVCGKVDKMLKMGEKQGSGPEDTSLPVSLDSLWGACVQDFCRR